MLDSRVPSVLAVEEARQIRSRRRKRDDGASGPQVGQSGCREKLLSDEIGASVPQTDTGRQVEHTQANGRTLVKELGKIAP